MERQTEELKDREREQSIQQDPTHVPEKGGATETQHTEKGDTSKSDRRL